MSKKNLIIIAVVLFLIAGSVAGAVAVPVIQNRLKPPVEITSISEIAKYYDTAGELWVDSDLVVIGEFEDQERIVEPNTPRNPGSQPPFHPGWRELAFSVTETLKGESEGLIWVAQRVSLKADGIGPSREDTLFQPGSRYVLFLRPSIVRPGEFFWPTGATQGGFLVVDDKVFSRSVAGEIPEGVGPTVEGVPLDQFIRDLKK